MQSLDATKSRSNAMTVADAFAFLQRRLWLSVAVFAVIFASSILLAFKLPPVYRAEATILIEQPTIPTDIVGTTVRTYVEEQIQVVSQRVMTAENILALIDEYSLYEGRFGVDPIEDIIGSFRDSTEVQNQTANFFDPRRGRVAGSTFAFVIAFQNEDPLATQRVANGLAELYLSENVRSRREQASDTSTFLEQESERLGQEIAEIERSLAEYKDQYANALPGQQMLNMQTLDRRERELLETGRDLIDQRSQRDQLTAQLSTISPYAALLGDDGQPIVSTGERLALLRQQYLELTGRYGAEHPDVIRVKREIDALSQGGAVADTDDIDLQIAALTSQRNEMLDTYSAEHPDVVRLERSIEALEEQRDEIVALGTSSVIQLPTNPDYVRIERQVSALNEGIRAAERRQIQLRSEIDELERNIAIAPRVEQEWLALNRGYDAARAEYNDVTQRTTQARLSERLEDESKGQRFTLLERARLPVSPIEPNRPSIIFLGFVLALGAGIGLAALVDTLDTTIRSVRDLSELLEMPPMATIPYMMSAREVRMQRVRRGSAIGGAVVATGILVWSLV